MSETQTQQEKKATETTPAGLPAVWRDEAGNQRRWGNETTARALEQCAKQLEDAHQSVGDALLSPTQAAAERDYSVDHIRKLIRQGHIKNYGRPGKPLVRRGDVPIKPGWLRKESSQYDSSPRVMVAGVAAPFGRRNGR